MYQSFVAHGGQLSRWMLVSCLAISAAVLTGCAGGQGGAGAAPEARRDLATESDRTDARRRAQTRLELAVAYFEQGQTNVALDELKQALAADPTYPDAYNMRGLIYMRLNENALAEESFRRAVALNPRDSDAQHNYGWLLCQQNRFPEAEQYFNQAVTNPQYVSQAKTFMALGLCQLKAGRKVEAEKSLAHSYEMDSGNSITGYNLAQIFYSKREFARAQFYIRRINNSDAASAESLWLGIKTERQINNPDAVAQLGGQLKRRFPTSKEAGLYDRGAFDE